ncbi:MAG: protein translocase subunit SecF, partial [Gammaproteobacteria bacterium]|nr:protein translocase subunit SecF [Gammaproteobacteria bacterium]
RKGDAIEVIDSSLNQTLSRTLITSLTTLLVLFALFIFGGELIHGFATALLAGVLVGTYSSVYVASSVLVAMDISKEDLAPVKKEGEQEEEVYEEV